MALETEAANPMSDTKNYLNQKVLTLKKLKRMLEVSSVICSTVSITMVIACQYGSVPDIFGFKSQATIFDLAFSLIVTSVVLGTLAMATSRIQDRKLKISSPAQRMSSILSNHLTALVCKNKDITGSEKLSKPANTHPLLNSAECIENFKEERGNQEFSNSLNNLSINNTKDAECSLKIAGKSTVFSSSEIRSPPQSQICHTPLLSGHCSVTQSPVHLTKSLKCKQFDLRQIENKSQLEPLLQQTFITNGHFNEVNTRNISDKYPQVAIVSPIKNNSIDVEYFDLYKKLSPSVESIHTCQKHPQIRFNPNCLMEQRSSCRNTDRMSNGCFKEENNILYESNASMKSFRKFPRSQQDIFNNRLHTKDINNLYFVQDKFPKVSHDSHEIPFTERLQTAPESFESSYRIFRNKKLNLHKMEEADFGDHCYNFHRKVTPNFKSFQNPLEDFKEAPLSQMGIINSHQGWNVNSKRWDKHFGERLDIPMEICDKAPNDKVLEVSMKLNDLNFMF